MTNIVEKPYTFKILSGRELVLTQIQKTLDDGFPIVNYKAFGARATVQDDPKHGKLIVISGSDNNLTVCKEIKKTWGVVAKPSNTLNFQISNETFDMLKSTEAEFKQPYEDAKKLAKETEEARIALLPKKLVFQTGIYWGDYSVESINEIIELRLEGEKWEENQRIFKNGKNGSYFDQDLLNAVTARPAFMQIGSYNCFELSQDEADKLIASYRESKRLADEAKALEEAEKARLKEEKLKAAEEAEKEAFANELFIWDADQVYSSASNLFLHSIGLQISREKNFISFYTTNYARDIERKYPTNTTYSIKEILKNIGCSYDGNDKEWKMPFSEENAEKAIAVLKQYDTKAKPGDLGMARCWECGTYSSKLDSSGYCGC